MYIKPFQQAYMVKQQVSKQHQICSEAIWNKQLPTYSFKEITLSIFLILFVYNNSFNVQLISTILLVIFN